MAQLIDSSVFIALERRALRLADLAEAVPDETVALASITASELLIAVHQADSTERRLRREVFIEGIFQGIPVLPFDLRVARVHARLWADLRASGQMIGAHDLLIAATALANEYAVLTENQREFQRVPRLIVRRPDW